MNHSFRAALSAAALAFLVSGCGSSEPEEKTAAPVPGPNRRISSNEKLKELIGKDGKPVWSPGKPMKPPTGSPKQ